MGNEVVVTRIKKRAYESYVTEDERGLMTSI